MAKVRSWVGLDVHARSVLAVTIDGESGELRSRRLSGMTSEVVEFCCSLPGPTRVAYEAGPTGYGLARALARGRGWVCGRGAGEDRAAGGGQGQDRSARRRAGAAPVDDRWAAPGQGPDQRRRRRCAMSFGRREAVRGDLMRARQRLSKLLLRHDVRYEDTASAWTVSHRGWLTRIDLGERGAQVTLLEYLGAIDAIVIRRDALEKTIAELIPGSPWEQTVARLRCLRGIDTLSAVGLCAEVGEFDAVREGRAADELPRPDPVRGHQRRETPARRRSPRPGRGTPAGCWSRPPGTTAAHPRRGRRSAAAKTDSPPTSSRSPGKPSDACTTSGSGSTLSAASAARSSRSPSPASSPASAGRSPTPTEPRPMHHVG